MMRHSKQ